jgi:hypothetical protein
MLSLDPMNAASIDRIDRTVVREMLKSFPGMRTAAILIGFGFKRQMVLEELLALSERKSEERA